MLNIAIFLFRAPVFCSFLEGICPFFYRREERSQRYRRCCRALFPDLAVPSFRTPSLDPASWCGVTRCVHSSQQQEERTKKCRRCYRAFSLGVCHRPRGLRNLLCSNSPRPSSSVGWSPPGPIKAVFASRSQLACALCGYGHSVHSRHSSLDAESRYRDEGGKKSGRILDGILPLWVSSARANLTE